MPRRHTHEIRTAVRLVPAPPAHPRPRDPGVPLTAPAPPWLIEQTPLDPQPSRGPARAPSARLPRPAVVAGVALLLALAGTGGWRAVTGGMQGGAALVASRGPTGPATAAPGTDPLEVGSPPRASTPPSTWPDTRATGPSVAAAAVPSALDRRAGVLSPVVAQRGGGRLTVVPGGELAPRGGAATRVRIEVESGLPVDGRAFASFVMDVLNDPRSWAHGGARTFARTAARADLRIVLASPDTSAELCAPLYTQGQVSCGIRDDKAVLTFYRWVKGAPDYGRDLTAYRRYLVNHEVGHVLGYGHELCPGPGRLAPVMQQQTLGLKGCRKNSWPFP